MIGPNDKIPTQVEVVEWAIAALNPPGLPREHYRAVAEAAAAAVQEWWWKYAAENKRRLDVQLEAMSASAA